MNRRKYLAISGGMVALAGCSGETDNEQSGEEPEEEEPEEESEPEDTGEAVFEITGIVNDVTFEEGDEVSIGGTIENTGDSDGEQTVKLIFEGEVVVEDETSLSSGEETRWGGIWDYSEFNPGTWEYVLETEDDEETAEITIEEPQEESSDSGYQVRVRYNGEWSGSISGDGSSRSVDGSGTETFDVDGDPFIVSANAQKQDDSSNELVIEILEDGEVIASKRTSAGYGVAQVTSEDGIDEGGDSDSTDDSGDSGSSYEVRIEYNGEWSGTVGSGGSTSSVDGSGTETIEIDGDPNIISANAQKQEANSDELVIQILEDGEVVKESSTTAEYGVAQVSYSNY